MGFWIFMLVMELMLPIMILAFGVWFQKNPPGQMNPIFGYRTCMSMKNIDTWNFAHRYCGRLWIRLGSLTVSITILAMLPVIGKNDNVVGVFGAIWVTVQCIVLLVLPIIQTEKELRRNFDSNGCRKNV